MFIIGTRGSALAMTQTLWVKEKILALNPGIEIDVRVIRTSADSDQKSTIRSGSATGVFVKEIEDALLAREVDLAVHSMKDVPTRIPDPLTIAAIPEREDPRDAVVTLTALNSIDDLPREAKIGTGSIRRQAQLLNIRDDLRILDIRGNVDTRIRKMEDGAFNAIILACAGLRRLGLVSRISLPLDPSTMLPAPGQGALALESRKDDSRVRELLSGLHHPPTAAAVFAERAFLRRMGGGCNSPIAVYGQSEDGGLTIEGLVAASDGSRVIRDRVGPVDGNHEEVAAALAEELLSRGGAELLRAAN